MVPRFLVLLFVTLGLELLAPAARATCTVGKVAELPVTMRGFRPTVTARINGVDAPFIFDSGMFFSMLSPASVTRFGLIAHAAPSNLIVNGVGGQSNVQVATARDFVFGGMTYPRPDFLINEKAFDSGVAGLLGANLIYRADVEYDLANGVIRLFQTDGCKDASLAYWASGKPYSVIDIESTNLGDPHIRGSVLVNGVKVRVIFDTGASTSILGLAAAARAGVTPQSSGVVEAGVSNGIGLRSYIKDWIGPFSSFKIGDEDIRNTRLRFGNMALDDKSEMLIGADFFLSHRILVSHSQKKLYFTYNGGPVFNLGVAPRSVAAASSGAPPSPAASAESTAYANTPSDAQGYSRRAAAFSARRDFTSAIDDLTKAIALEPGSANYLYQRAVAHMGNRQPLLARADFDQALALKPDDIPVLLARAELRVARADLDGAKQDLALADHLVAKEPERRRGLAAAYQRAGLWAESINQLDLWIAANPNDDGLAPALNARCWARARLGQDLDKALVDCNAALRILPDDPVFLDSRALAYLRRGDFDRGITDEQALLRLSPTNAWALYGRGWARLKKGQTDLGEADIKAATLLRPQIAEEARTRGLAL